MRLLHGTVLLACLSLTPFVMGQARPVGGRIPRPRLGAGTVTVTATPSTISIPLQSGAATFASSPIVLTTTFSGLSVLSSISLYASFASATAALSGGNPVANIPSSCVLGQMTTGAPITYTAFTATTPYGGAGAGLTLLNGVALLTLGGSRTDSLNLEVNLASLPQLPAATYSGTVTFTATIF